MSRRATAAALALLAAFGLGVIGCGEDDEGQQPERTTSESPTRTPTTTTPSGRQPVRAPGAPEVETIATGLEAPWEIAFLPDGRALVTERPGRVRLFERGTLRGAPVAEVDVEPLGEGGLLGAAIDPRFEVNRYVYLYRTFSGNQVVRYRLTEAGLEDETVLVQGIAASSIHNGGRLHFGPDQRLYFSTGDAGQDTLAQEPGSLNGKLLRLTPAQYRGEGGQPEVVSLGHRNPQGFDWEPGSGRLFSDEHGPDGDDELNVISRGSNYGWPLVRGSEHREFEAPVAVYQDSIAPSGGTFVSLPGSEWSGDYLFAALVGEQMRRVRLDAAGRAAIDEAVFEGEFGRLRTVVEGPDGALYALTSNTDGRGSPRQGDDRILRIVPPAG